MSEPLLIIANPVSGGGRAKTTAQRAMSYLESKGVATQVIFTSGKGHATELAQEALNSGMPRIVACGGDGLIHEIVNVLAESNTELGLIPAGRGNDLARALGVPTHPERAARLLINGVIRRIDLGRVNGRLFSTIVTLGLDSEVAHLVYEKQVPFSGTGAYIIAVLRTLKKFAGVNLRMSGDFGTVEQLTLLTATGNTATYGGGMKILPGAIPSDGLLDICHVKMMRPFAVLKFFPTVFWGGHPSLPEVTLYRSASVRLETDERCRLFADGEPVGYTPATVQVVPNALAVLVPADRLPV